MSLVRIDWNPSVRKVRQFGAILAALALVLGLALLRCGRPGGFFILAAGLGLLTAIVPALGFYVYKGWMCVAFIMGTITSFVLLALIYYLMFAPLAFLFSIVGRDALRKRPAAASTGWHPLEIPDDADYFRRLF